MPDDWHTIATGVRYRGLDVTLLGNDTAGLLAIAGYGTPNEVAIGAISVEHHRGCRVYCLAGARGCMPHAQSAAEAVVRARQAGDARGH